MNVICPFCHEDGFDLQGLKLHLSPYTCEGYSATPYFEEGVKAGDNVIQVSSDDWRIFEAGKWRVMTVDEQIAWSAKT